MSTVSALAAAFAMMGSAWAAAPITIENAGFRLTVDCSGEIVRATLDDLKSGLRAADGPMLYFASREETTHARAYNKLIGASATLNGGSLVIQGRLAGLDVEQAFTLPTNTPIMEERVVLRNPGPAVANLDSLRIGFVRTAVDAKRNVLPELASDRWIAVPFRHKATDPKGYANDFSIHDLLFKPGWEPCITARIRYSQPPSTKRPSEGWAWLHDGRALCILHFSQENMVWSVVEQISNASADVNAFAFGGAFSISGEPALLTRLKPGEQIDLGITRYFSVTGGYEQACRAFRELLDEHGCRFPKDYNPPVHWEQLYDMEGAWNDRPHRYTKEALDREAAKGRAYSCEALYLDPGWDTAFATFIWGDWLGPRKAFIEDMRRRYDLAVSLHCPLATWMSIGKSMGPDGMASWPQAARRKPPADNAEPAPAASPRVCLGSKQYLDEAEKRLLANCADGVAFLMFDGTWWNGGCDDTNHGHPVPYRWEDHIRACVDLARRVHAKYPKVLIEMHDMLAGGRQSRPTPIYYKYGLPGSYDCNWGFELMWNPMTDIKQGRARTLYEYNIGCNIPVYLHIDLRKDNQHCLMLWWYASTCRHLGIGGTHPDAAIRAAQQAAMHRYHELEWFYKQGEFVGLSEEVHAHVLPAERACVINIFNLTDNEREITAACTLADLGLSGGAGYRASADWARVEADRLTVHRVLPAWGADVVELRPVP